MTLKEITPFLSVACHTFTNRNLAPLMAVCVGSVECKSISSGITSSPVLSMEGHAVTVSPDSMKLACAIIHKKSKFSKLQF